MAKTLTVVLAADVGRFKKDMNEAENSVQGLGGKIKNNLEPALIGIGAAAGAFALKVGTDAVLAAGDLSESVNKANVIFGEGAAAVTAFAENANTQLGSTREAAIAAASTFGTFGKAAGLTGKDLADFSTELVTLATDLASFNNTPVDQAVNALGAALRGEAEPIRTFGVLLDDATLKQQALEMGIYDGNGALTQQQKVLAANAAILKQTGDAQGDFARTSTGLANTLKILQAQIEDLQVELGVGFLEALGDTSDATGQAQDTLEDFKPIFKDIGADAGEAALTFKAFADSAFILGKSFTTAGEQGDEILRRALFSTKEELAELAQELRYAGGSLEGFGVIADRSAQRVRNLSSANREAASSTAALSAATGISVARALDRNAAWQAYLDRRREEDDLNKRVAGSGSAAAKVDEKLLKLFDRKSAALDDLRTKFEEQQNAVEKARGEIEKYIGTIQGQVLGAIDLGAAYESQFDDEGKATGKTFLESFNEQLAQGEWFGNVLQAIKGQGADQKLIEEIASLGPAVGGALGQQLLDDGLVQTLNTKFMSAVEAARGVGEAMVPEFAITGYLGAVGMLNETAMQLKADLPKWAKLGNRVGKPIGDQLKSEILASVAEAVKEAQAAGTAARAEVAAREAARQAVLTEQAQAEALARLIRNSDARAGRAVTPVLS